MDLKDYLRSRSIPEPNTGCWLWLGVLNHHGYGMATLQVDGLKRTFRAHRLSFEAFTGSKIPSGLGIDHLCRVRCCINPEHLEPVTAQENTNRGVTAEVNRAMRLGARQTHCKRGHEFTPETTYVNGSHRHCLICSRAMAQSRLRRLHK